MDINAKEILFLYTLLLDFKDDCDEALEEPGLPGAERDQIIEDRRMANQLARKFLKFSKAQGFDIAALLKDAGL